MPVTKSRAWVTLATFGIVVGVVAVAGLFGRGVAPYARSTTGIPDVGNGWARPTTVDAVSLSQALSAVPYEVPRPNDELASDASLDAAFVDREAETVRFDYKSGVIVTVSPWPKGKDPAKSYQQQWTESGGLGTLGTIGSNPAWLVPGDAKPTMDVPGGGTSFVIDSSMNTVELAISNLDIVIAGHQSVDDLVRVALSEK